MWSAVVAGVLLGLTAGLAPGPLLTLVLAQSLQRGAREGCKVAVAPLITDAPIILVSWGLAARAAELQTALGLLAIAGGAFVLYLAWETIRAPAVPAADAPARLGAWRQGILTNILSPHPWLFWMTIGAATMAQALRTGRLAVAMFLVAFYTLLVGSKILLALLAGRAQAVVRGRAYRWLLVILGILLAMFAVLLMRDGVQRLR